MRCPDLQPRGPEPRGELVPVAKKRHPPSNCSLNGQAEHLVADAEVSRPPKWLAPLDSMMVFERGPTVQLTRASSVAEKWTTPNPYKMIVTGT